MPSVHLVLRRYVSMLVARGHDSGQHIIGEILNLHWLEL